MTMTTYMVIKRFRNNDPIPVYRRFRDIGRVAPDWLHYVASWINEEVTCCYQITETSDRHLLDQCFDNWKDTVDFIVFPVINSKEALEKVSPKL
jgi:hypothetical protein